MGNQLEELKLKIPMWYRQKLWSASMVQKAVDKGILTADEAEQILNQEG